MPGESEVWFKYELMVYNRVLSGNDETGDTDIPFAGEN